MAVGLTEHPLLARERTSLHASLWHRHKIGPEHNRHESHMRPVRISRIGIEASPREFLGRRPEYVVPDLTERLCEVDAGLRDIDTPISGYLPQYFAPISKNDKRRTITVRHLLTMSSGLPSTSIYNYGEWVSSRDWIAYALSQDLVYEPGSRMTYSTGDTHLLAAVLASAAGTPLRAYAQRHLFDALGVQIGGWDRDPQGNYFGGNNMALSPQALLAFGRLYLDGGVYEARRVLSKDWIDASWTPRFLNSSFNTRHDYGYLWWHTRYAGHSAWFAWGYGGQFLFVLPSLNAIVVFTGDPDARTRGGNDAIYDLMEQTIVPHLAQRSVP